MHFNEVTVVANKTIIVTVAVSINDALFIIIVALLTVYIVLKVNIEDLFNNSEDIASKP